MAKSLRSKLKRKHLAVRREKNKPRELEKLKQILKKKNPIDDEMKAMTTGYLFPYFINQNNL